MNKIISSTGGKSEVHIYYLHEVKKVERLSTTLAEVKVRFLGAVTIDRRAAERKR